MCHSIMQNLANKSDVPTIQETIVLHSNVINMIALTVHKIATILDYNVFHSLNVSNTLKLIVQIMKIANGIALPWLVFKPHVNIFL